jgi:hypothetical protein
MDGMKQVINAYPLLKPAITQPKIEKKPEEEKTLEELVTVVSAYGLPSNLQNMKDLLEASQILRKELARAFALGRTYKTFLSSPGADPFRNFGNLDNFAAQLFEEISKK